MARPKIIRNAEEAKNVPEDLPIQVELPPEGQVQVAPENEAANKAAEERAAQERAEAERGEEVSGLKKQLEELRKASDLYKQQAEEASRREAQARKEAEERSSELKTMGSRAEQAEYDAVINAMSAAQSEADRAESDVKTAAEAADWVALSKAQAILARAHSRLLQLEDAKAGLEDRAERLKKERDAPAPRASSGDPVMDHINNIPNILPSQREWLGKHRDLLTDPKKNIRLQNAHIDAEEAGHATGSEEYFQFLEERLGYRKVDKVVAREDDDDDDETDKRPPIVSAPPSRESSSLNGVKQTPTRITLSSAQREAARLAGVDEVTYARELIKMEEQKKNGLLQ